MRTALLRFAYALAMLALAAALVVCSTPGAVVARSYAAYNGRPVPDAEGRTYRTVDLPYANPFTPVTAAQAAAIKNGVVVFAFPQCPYCRNLIPALAAAAARTGTPVAYCPLDRYRDRYVYDPQTAAPVQTQPAGPGYAQLLAWLYPLLDDYTVPAPDGTRVPVGEKRISAPTLIKVQNGVPTTRWALTDAAVFADGLPADAYAAWDADTQEAVTAELTAFLTSP